MTRILLIRHGHVAGIVPKRFRGRLNLPLSEEGRVQVVEAARYIASRYAPAAIYSSPLQRCMDSAAALSAQPGMPPAQAVQNLNDTDYGTWQGRLATEVAEQEPVLHAQWRSTPQTVTFPQGESLERVASRVMGELAVIVQRHGDATVAVYSHDSVTRVVLLAALGASFSSYHRLRVDPCSLSELRYESPEHVEVERINERTT